MKIKISKNFYALSVTAIFVFFDAIAVMVFIAYFTEQGEFLLWPFVITLAAINLPFALSILLPFKFSFSTIHITDNDISTYLFSKKLTSFNWDELDGLKFNPIFLMRRGKAIRFYKKSEPMSFVEFDLSERRLKILKKLPNIKPELKLIIDDIRTAFLD